MSLPRMWIWSARPRPTRTARLAELRFFGGLTIEEAAALDVSAATVKRSWLTAKAWLERGMECGRGS